MKRPPSRRAPTAWLAVALCVGLLGGFGSSLAHADLPPAVAAELTRAGIPTSRVAVFVQALDAATPLLTHNPDAALNPASTMKLVTSFAALDTLGPAWRWHTELWANGDLRDGKLAGDLVIRGSGDPTFTLERVWLMQRELRRAGVAQIDGGLVLDTGAFDAPAVDPGAFDGEPLKPYNAPPGALVANFNAVPLRVSVTESGVVVAPEIAFDGLVIDNRIVRTDAACADWRDDLAFSVVAPARGDDRAAEGADTGAPADGANDLDGFAAEITPPATLAFRQTLRVSGTYSARCGTQTLALNLADPAVTFDRTFRSLWAEGGGRIARTSVPGTAPAREPLLRVASPPLAEALVPQNKFSSNLMTKNLFLSLGAAADDGTKRSGEAVQDGVLVEGGALVQDSASIQAGSAPHRVTATFDKAAHAVRAALARHALDTRKLVLDNGAGLSRIERVSARLMAGLLRAAARQAWAAEFEASLPIAGVDGTLARRFVTSPAAGQAHLKSGTLRDVSALAGYVLAASGQKFAYVMIVNHANARRAGAAHEALLDWVWRTPAATARTP